MIWKGFFFVFFFSFFLFFFLPFLFWEKKNFQVLFQPA